MSDDFRNSTLIDDLIERHVRGMLSSEEIMELRQWIALSEDNAKYYREHYLIYKSADVLRLKGEFEKGKERAFSEFLRSIASPNLQRVGAKPALFSILKYAAVFAIALLLGGLLQALLGGKGGSQMSAKQCIEVPYGSKSKVILPDGTSIWLNSGSKFTYDAGFGKTNRTVTLDGEGCFAVAHNKKLPFTVHSGKVYIKVLGTTFNFKSYSQDKRSRITLIDGSLAVADPKTERIAVTLKPNEQAVIEGSTEKLKVKNVEAKEYAQWTLPVTEVAKPEQPAKKISTPNKVLRNTLFFDEESMEQIAIELERAYNVKISIENEPLKKLEFYGDFRNNENVEEILRMLASGNKFSYKLKGDKILIY